MPINLNDVSSTVKAKAYTPKFFSKILTGNGKTTGLINELTNPMHIVREVSDSNIENILNHKKKVISGKTTTEIIPVNPILMSLWRYMRTMPYNDATYIGSNKNVTPEIEYYIKMQPHALTYCQIDNGVIAGAKSVTKTFDVNYHIQVYAICDKRKNEAEIEYNMENLAEVQENKYINIFSYQPIKYINACLNEIENKSTNFKFDRTKIQDYITNYSLYDEICKRAEEWQTEKIAEMFDKLLVQLATDVYSVQNEEQLRDKFNKLVHELRFLEEYNIPLNLYQKIYQTIKTNLKPEHAHIFCKQNLNLLLSDTMTQIENVKPTLNQIPVNPKNNVDISFYSPEQQKAITTTEPLVLVQAGAGTGKSTVILGRIKHMIGAGIEPEDITVLSFTNAAADNIKDKNPGVNSMTIAAMINQIYEYNYPKQQLSGNETIINCLSAYYPDDKIAQEFIKVLSIFTKKEPTNAYVTLNSFVENNFDAVEKLLDDIKLTSLELEIVICYQKCEQMSEPQNLKNKHIIIDEVQDNSIFEFIYTLKYCLKNKNTLFMVGDCSQTLYEFRASNPKALNVLENSGVFTAYQLQVNYRSNQEILTMANAGLRDIEANQYANIQLQANSLNTVTEQSFLDKVHLSYEQVIHAKDLNEYIETTMQTTLKPYIDEKIANGEKVALLAFKRKEVQKLKSVISSMYPNKVVTDLCPAKTIDTTIFSDFLKTTWNQMSFVSSSADITAVIADEIAIALSKKAKLSAKAQKAILAFVTEWRVTNKPIIDAWAMQVSIGKLSLEEYLNNVKENMISFEISKNAARQSTVANKNRQMKQDNSKLNADFVVSTIHSAKGLEFDNTIVLYKDEPKMSMKEEDKRLYYVAFTRAMNSEYILAYGNNKGSSIETDYYMILKDLHARYPAANSPLNVIQTKIDNT